MNHLKKWIEMYFAGTYLHFLEKENGKKLEYHWYFAASTVFMVAAYNLMFLTGLAVTLGFGDVILASKYSTTAILLVFLLSCWAYFFRAERYREIVGRWVSKKNYARQAAMRFNWFLLTALGVMLIRFVIVV